MLSLHLFKIKERIERTEAELKRQTNGRYLAEIQLTKGKTALEEMGRNLETANRATAQADAESLSQKNRAEELGRSLATLYKENDQTKADLARYQNTGLKPEQIVQVAAELKNLHLALANAQKEIAGLKQLVRKQIEQAQLDPIPLPSGLEAKVLRYDPKWRFVVLDTGAKQGMLKNAELLVGRGGNLVGKIKISTVEKEQSIGNLVTGWQLSDIVEGDFAIPAFFCENW